MQALGPPLTCLQISPLFPGPSSMATTQASRATGTDTGWARRKEGRYAECTALAGVHETRLVTILSGRALS